MKKNTLPPYLMTSEKGSFARKTIEERKPQIINQILSSFDFPANIQKLLEEFKDELATGKIKPLRELTSDRCIWDQDLAPWQDKTWFEIPWFLAETFFYRRVLEITHYFQPGPFTGIDPFEPLKNQEILDGEAIFEDIYPSLAKDKSFESFHAFCIKSLWGNRGDLSHVDALDPSMSTQSHRIILDEANQAYQYLSSNQPGRMAYFFDNVGKELFFDLALIDYLIQTKLASRITCILKNQPFFVSDAMPKDLMKSIDMMSASESSEVQLLAERLITGIKSSIIQVESPPFTTYPRMYREIPEALGKQIRTNKLAILKGDVNYRRLMGDCHWPPTTPVEEAGGYFPIPFLIMRTLKAELVVGLTDDILAKINQEADPEWLINGKRGLINFHRN